VATEGVQAERSIAESRFLNCHHLSGCEICIINGYKAVEIQGVRLEKFGKDRFGSYQIHFPKVRERAGRDDADRQQQHRPQL
jgi:hypothetical protein